MCIIHTHTHTHDTHTHTHTQSINELMFAAEFYNLGARSILREQKAKADQS